MKKILFLLIFLLFCTPSYASFFTEHYNLEHPSIGSKDVYYTLSRDYVSIDAVLNMVSQDTSVTDTEIGIISNDISLISKTVVIISNDTVDWNKLHDIISNDISLISPTVVILSNDVGVLKTKQSAISDTVVILSNDTGVLKGFVDQDVTSGSAPTFSATNFSDGGSNAIVTTTQETNWDNDLTTTTIISNDVGTLKTTQTHISGDVAVMKALDTTISGDIAVMKALDTTISGDVAVMKILDGIISNDISLVSGTVAILSTDVAGLLPQQKDIHLIEPDQIFTVTQDSVMFTVDSYNYPNGIKITAIRLAASESTTLFYTLQEWAAPDWENAASSTIDELALSGAVEVTETTITDPDIAVGGYVVISCDAVDVDWTHITVWFNAKD